MEGERVHVSVSVKPMSCVCERDGRERNEGGTEGRREGGTEEGREREGGREGGREVEMEGSKVE